tara:strand:+ start:159 stop:341 length:183 start_codon:yes stop_codon:yes gene_type:complete
MDKVLEDLLDLKNASFIEITPVEEITSSGMYFENNFTENPERFCPNCKCDECVKIFKIKS